MWLFLQIRKPDKKQYPFELHLDESLKQQAAFSSRKTMNYPANNLKPQNLCAQKNPKAIEYC